LTEVPAGATVPGRRRRGALEVLWLAALVAAAAAGIVIPFTRSRAVPEIRRGVGPDIRPSGWDERRKEFAVRAEQEQGAVVFLGDSITDWWTGLAAAFPEIRVANRGIAGDTARGLLARLQDDVLSLRPRAVVLLIGTNDLAVGATPAQVTANVRDLLALIAESDPECPVVLCLVMPRRPRPGLFPDLLLDLNARLRAVADVRRGITLCDSWTPFADELGRPRPSEFPDGLHPNENGYEIWGREVRAALVRAGVIPAGEPR